MPHIYNENNKSWKIYKDEKECIDNVVYAYLINENEYDGEEKIETRFFEIADDDYIEIYQKFSVMTKLDFTKPEGKRAGELFIMVNTNNNEEIEIYLVDNMGNHITEIDDYFSLDLPEGFTDEPNESGLLDSETDILIDSIKRCSKNLEIFNSNNAITLEMTPDFIQVLSLAIETSNDNYRYNNPLFSSIHFVNIDCKLELHSTTGSIARIIKTTIPLPATFVSTSIPRDVLKYLWQYKNPEVQSIKILGEISANNPNDFLFGILINNESYSYISKQTYKNEITRIIPTENSGSIICNSSELKKAVEELNDRFCVWAKKKELIKITPSNKYPDLIYARSIDDEDDSPKPASMFWGNNDKKHILVEAIDEIEDKNENCIINITQDLFSSLIFSFRGKCITTVPAEINFSQNIDINIRLDHLNIIAGKSSKLSDKTEFKLNELEKAILIENEYESIVFMPIKN